MTKEGNNITSMTDYCGNIIYTDSTLAFILMPESRLVPLNKGVSGDLFQFEYFIKDHLGNTRLVVSDSGKVLESDSYYPFGLNIKALSYSSAEPENRYLYNGKELQTDFGLEWLDYGARHYDAQIGRWHAVDPMAEKYYDMSPYNYVANNPLIFIDPDGMELWHSSALGSHWSDKYDENKESQQTNQEPWIPVVDDKNGVQYIAEKGDDILSLISQFGLSIEDAKSILKKSNLHQGIKLGLFSKGNIKAGAMISGEIVKDVTGSNILKLNGKYATSNDIVSQTIFAIRHNNLRMNKVLDLDKYMTNISAFPMLYGMLYGEGNYHINGKSYDFFIEIPNVKTHKMDPFPNNPTSMTTKPGWTKAIFSDIPYSKYGGKALKIQWYPNNDEVIDYLKYRK